jgi:hypothetical protein
MKTILGTSRQQMQFSSQNDFNCPGSCLTHHLRLASWPMSEPASYTIFNDTSDLNRCQPVKRIHQFNIIWPGKTQRQ